MKAKMNLNDLATFEGYSTSPNGNEFVNVSGIITFLVNYINKLIRKGKEVTTDQKAVNEAGGKYFFASYYPFPAKGEKIDPAKHTPVIAAKKDHFKTDAELKKVIQAITDAAPDNWQVEAMKVIRSAKQAFSEDKPKVTKQASKATIPAEIQQVIAKLVDKHGCAWEGLENAVAANLTITAEKHGIKAAAFRKAYDERYRVKFPDEPEQDSLENDFGV